MRVDPRSGFTALFATKQLLNYTCVDPIAELRPIGDTRQIRGYVISKRDWQELERWYYQRAGKPMPHYSEMRPVMMRTMYTDDQYYNKLGCWLREAKQ